MVLEGKTTPIPKPGEFICDNQRPTTCLNNVYTWYTSCLLAQASQHIEHYGLIQREHCVVQGATAVERLTIYLSIGWFVRMLREESKISAWHGLMWLRRVILLIMVGYLKCSPYTELLPKPIEANRSPLHLHLHLSPGAKMAHRASLMCKVSVIIHFLRG